MKETNKKTKVKIASKKRVSKNITKKRKFKFPSMPFGEWIKIMSERTAYQEQCKKFERENKKLIKKNKELTEINKFLSDKITG